MATAWQVRTGSADDLDLVGPLWVAVHHRHAETMPELAPYVSDERTWSVRRELYEELLTKPHTLLLVAFDGEWTRRVVPSPEWARAFAKHLEIPGYDAAVVGYPQRMRDYNTRNKKHPYMR